MLYIQILIGAISWAKPMICRKEEKMKKCREWTKWMTGLLVMTMVLVLMTGCGGSDSAEKTWTNSATQGFMSEMAEEAYYDMDSLGMDMNYGMAESQTGSPSAGQMKESDAASQQSSRKLIRTVNMSVETKEFDAVMGTLEQRVTELGGYIENMDTYNGSVYSSSRSSRRASMTARIPAGQLNVFLSEVSEISNVTRRTENVQDVTLDYVDLASHKKTLQAEHDRLLELMERAEYIEDIITIEQRLSNVQYQIESMEAQLRTYDNKVDYSTVNLDVSEVQELTPVEVHEETLWERISGGFMENLKKVGNGALEIVVWLLVHIPTLVVWALFITLFIVWIRWIQKRDRIKAEKKRMEMQMQNPQNPVENIYKGGNNPHV